MFRAFPLPIIRSYLLYIRRWYIPCRFDDSFQGSCHQTCKEYTIAECTVDNSWWWAKEIPETRRVFWQRKVWEIRASGWFYWKESFLRVRWVSPVSAITQMLYKSSTS